MTNVSTLIDGGIEPGIAEATRRLRAHPADHGVRTLLFELLCLQGSWDRASKQLEMLTGVSAEQDAAVGQYGMLLDCERQRREVFAGKSDPVVSEQASELAALHYLAVRLVHYGRIEEAAEVLEGATDLWTLPACDADSKEYAAVRDCDDLIAPFLEVIFEQKYCWIGWHELEQVQIGEPRYLRDLIWQPANLRLRDGRVGPAFLPALYPGSESGVDEIRTGGRTIWTDGALTLGEGQRMLELDDTERDLRSIRQMHFHA